MKTDYNIRSTGLTEVYLSDDLGLNMFEGNEKTSHIDEPGLGKVTYRVKQCNGIRISEWKSVFCKRVALIGEMPKHDVFSLGFNLKGNLETKIGRNDPIQVNKASHNIWSLPGGGMFVVNYYEKGEENHFVSFGLQETYLQGLVNRYPGLIARIYQQHKNKSFIAWNKYNIHITNEIYQVLRQVNHADMFGKFSSMFIESKVLELLTLQLYCPIHGIDCHGKFCKTNHDIEQMYEARDIIVKDLEAPPTICELAKQVGVNEKKLKYGFREIFNQTVYGYLFEHKMRLARQLLLDTDKSIYEVAHECGYHYSSHFTTAFKRKFGITPKEFRGDKS